MNVMAQNFIEIASRVVETYYPNCSGALLAGSVVRGEENETSDLDIVILDSNVETAYRESFSFDGMQVEAFIYNELTIREFFKSDAERARPSLPKMVVEGIVIKDCSLISDLKKEATELLENGPSQWDPLQVNIARYFITDLLDDFIGSTNSNELIFIASALSERVHEFYLRTNNHWIGQSKWIYRALKNADESFADRFASTFDEFYRFRDKEKVIEMVDHILKPFGGRLKHGFSIGKKED